MIRFAVVAVSLLFLLTTPAHACYDGTAPGSALAPDDPLRSMPPQDPVPVCPLPSCGPPPPWQPCPVLNGTPPFTRHVSMGSGPVPGVAINCFAVARNASGYHLLFTEANTGGAGTFDRYESTDGGITWNFLGPTSSFLSASWPWVRGVQCPDPHFTGAPGHMTMIFSGHRAAGSIAVGRATSTDYGQTWGNVQEIVSPTSSHFPYMPSLIPLSTTIGGGYLLSYAWVCNGSVTAGATLDVLFSQDGITSWQQRAVPGVPTGTCNKWDDGSVNRPRLIVDALVASTIHMFYSAYEWNGVNQPTRNCGRIGEAISTDAGFTWVKKTRPVFEPSASSWDEEFVLKPTLVVEPCGPNAVLRLFYQGRGANNLAGLGIADAPWPFGSAGCGAAELALGEEAPEEDDQPLARLTSAPNPTSGTTSIGIDLSRVNDAGGAELTIVDVTGRLVRSLWTGSTLAAPNAIEWDGRENGGSRVVPGRYLARMRLANETLGTHWITMTR